MVGEFLSTANTILSSIVLTKKKQKTQYVKLKLIFTDSINTYFI